ncbi:hypothetical protein [Agromyces sp. NPDC060279]|uniref:hypothetical protein n=1 Tax=Agromyces sp. NPDC060279 TaxID=3347092 RepID=UPI003654D75B
MAPGVGVVTGGNGAGKTTLLRGLQTLEDVHKAVWPERLEQVEAKGCTSGVAWAVTLQRAAGEGQISVSVSEGDAPRLVFIDPAEESQRIRRHFQDDANARDLLEGTDPAPFDEVWLDHASRILRRDYDQIEVFEVEGPDEDTVVPWFQIGAMGANYDILSAGRGELSAMYLLWRLARVEDDTIVIIDEPEAWLASFSQARLKETLAFLSSEQGLHFVLTTHSPDLYLGLPASRVTVLESLPSPVAYGPMSSPKAAHSLGAPIRPTLALLTEDAVAAALTEAILRYNDPILLEGVEIFHARNGESALTQVQREFIDGQTRRRRLNMQVVLDGDQRQLNRGNRVKSDKRTYLPGNVAPDAILKSVATAAVSGLTDAQLRRFGVADPVQFRLAVSAAAGSDHHDWFIEVARGFGSYSATCDVLVRLCSADAEFAADAEALVKAILNGMA